eukprot:6446732-Prymnesium_polylepis.1
MLGVELWLDDCVVRLQVPANRLDHAMKLVALGMLDAHERTALEEMDLAAQLVALGILAAYKLSALVKADLAAKL